MWFYVRFHKRLAKKETGTLLMVLTVFSQLSQPLVSDFKVSLLSPHVASAFCWFHNLIQEAKEQLLCCQGRCGPTLCSIRAIQRSWLPCETASWVLWET